MLQVPLHNRCRKDGPCRQGHGEQHPYYPPPQMASSHPAPIRRQVKKKKKPNMSLRESAAYLSSSKYIRNLATLVIAYGMSINIVEVTWKAKLKQASHPPHKRPALASILLSSVRLLPAHTYAL
mgnify:CR=1 FL=1